MKCKWIRNHLMDYLNNRLDRELYDTISDHLAACPKCSRELDFWRIYFQNIPTPKPESAPVDFLARVRAKTIDAMPKSKWSFSSTRFVRLTGALTGLAAVCLIFFFLLLPRPLPLSSNESSEKNREILKNRSTNQINNTAPIAAVEKPVLKQANKIAVKPSSTPPVLSELALCLKINLPLAMNLTVDGDSCREVIPDKAAGFMSKSASAPVETPPPDLRTRLSDLIQSLGGQISDTVFNSGSNQLQKITCTLPAAKYLEFTTGLNGLGQLVASPSGPPGGTAQLRIVLQMEYLP